MKSSFDERLRNIERRLYNVEIACKDMKPLMKAVAELRSIVLPPPTREHGRRKSTLDPGVCAALNKHGLDDQGGKEEK